MADDVIRYVYEGDSSRLQQATQQAIDSLTLYESTVKNIQSTLDSLMSGINETVDWIQMLSATIKDLISMTATASDAFKNYKNSATEVANAMRSVAMAQQKESAATAEAAKNVEESNESTKNSTEKWIKFGKALTDITKKFDNVKVSTKETSNVIKDLGDIVNSTSTFIKTLFGVDIVNVFEKSAMNAMDYIENLNLFNVAMGESIDTGKEFVSQMQEVYGLDPSNIMTYVGNFNQLASAIEMPAKTAAIVSTNMTKMATDMASLFNMDVVDVIDNMRSGMIGMTRAVTKYGIDIRTSTLQQTALSLGITENVRNMSEASREGLRYITMMRQASSVSGDWAKTIESPANQLRILKEQLTQLSRAIGNLFLPIIAKVLPYINGFIMALRTAIQAIAEFFGFTDMDFGGSVSTIDKGTDAIESMGDAADDTAKKIKSLRAPFDKLNVLQAESSKSSGDSGYTSEIMDPAIVSAIESLNVPLENIRMKANEVRDAILAFFNLDGASFTKVLTRIKDLGQKVIDIFKALKEAFINAFEYNGSGEKILNTFKTLCEDIYSWLDRIIQDTLDWAQDLNLGPIIDAFGNLFEAIRKVANVVGDELESVYRNILLPLAEWTIEKGLPDLINALADALSWFADHPTISAILIGIGTAFASIGGAIKGMFGIASWIGSLVTGLGQLATALGFESIVAMLSTAAEGLAAIAPQIAAVVAAVVAVVTALVLILTHLDEIKKWVDTAKTKFSSFLDSIKKKLDPIVQAIQPTLKSLSTKWTEVYTKISGNIGAVKKKISEITTTLKKVFSVFSSVAKACWKVMKANIIDPLSSLYKRYIKPIVNAIQKYVINWLAKKFDGLVKSIVNVFVWGINRIIGFFESLINGIVRSVNKLVRVANKIPGTHIAEVTPVKLSKINYLAQGGVVTGPTQAVIGEGKYDEAVLPLGNSPQMDEMLDKFADKVNSRPIDVKVQIGDRQWDAFTYQSAKRGEKQLGKPIVGGNTRG